MTLTYDSLATTTLGSATGSITFSSIPSSYTDLRVVWHISGITSGSSNPGIRFNGDTSGTHSTTLLRGNGTNIVSSGYSSQNMVFLGGTDAIPTTSVPMLILIDIFSYSGSTQKTCLSSGHFEREQTGGAMVKTVGRWANTSAINSLTLLLDTGSQNVGTTASLYGIKAE